ncbi:MAG: hypothetical protein WC777_02490 [Candidatus Gracilibacteria bacterium]|jgi:hypothetical protein
MPQLLVGIAIAIFILVYLFYSSLTIKHAARFRFLSQRTVYLTIFFVISSAVLIIALLSFYGMFLF